MKIVEALSTVNKGITRDEISEITGIWRANNHSQNLNSYPSSGSPIE